MRQSPDEFSAVRRETANMAMPARFGIQSVRNACTRSPNEAHLIAGQKRWIGITFFIGFPLIFLSGGRVFYESYILGHTHERPEFIKYDHLRLRIKKYPWRDGVKTLFHNSHMNALPDGYEDEMES